MSQLPNPLDHRKADHPIETIFLNRWSPRAMSGESVSDEDISRLFEAARWAPSTYNEQEWRFLYAKRDTPHWPAFFDALVEPNQAWCDKAGVLIVVTSGKKFSKNGKPNPVHTFDSGLASQNLLLQGCQMGLVVHGMAGFDRDKARSALKIPEDYEVEAMIAVGKPGDPDQRPEGYADMDKNPSGRKPIGEITCEGPWSLG